MCIYVQIGDLHSQQFVIENVWGLDRNTSIYDYAIYENQLSACCKKLLQKHQEQLKFRPKSNLFCSNWRDTCVWLDFVPFWETKKAP